MPRKAIIELLRYAGIGKLLNANIYQVFMYQLSNNNDNYNNSNNNKFKTCLGRGWSGWADWSTCSVTCGIGQRRRHREYGDPTPSLLSQYYEGFAQESELCNQFPCKGAFSLVLVIIKSNQRFHEYLKICPGHKAGFFFKKIITQT